MTTEKMNVHQALAELKTIDDRITKGVKQEAWVVANKRSSDNVRGIDKKAWIDQVKSNYQSVTDLIRRRDAIKRAVVNSNAVTKVLIAGTEYTVAEAIDKKNNGVAYLTILLNQITSDYNRARMSAEMENGDRLEGRADQYIRSLIGNTDTKGMSAEIERMRKEFIDKQGLELIDPIKAMDEVKKLNDEITSFLTNVDAALSTSNALTEITVEY